MVQEKTFKKKKKIYKINRNNTLKIGKNKNNTNKKKNKYKITQKGGKIFENILNYIDVKLLERFKNLVNSYQFSKFIKIYNNILQKLENELENVKSNGISFQNKAISSAEISTNILTNHRIKKIFGLRKSNLKTDQKKFNIKAVEAKIKETEIKEKTLNKDLINIGELLNKYKKTYENNYKRYEKTDKKLNEVYNYFEKNISNIVLKINNLTKDYFEFSKLKPSQLDSQQKKVILEYNTYTKLYKKISDFQSEGKLNKLTELSNDFYKFHSDMEYYFDQYKNILKKKVEKNPILNDWDMEIDNFWDRLKDTEEILNNMKYKFEELQVIIKMNKELIATEGINSEVAKYQKIDEKLQDCIDMFSMLKEQVIGIKLNFFSIVPAINLSFDINLISTLINTSKAILTNIADELNQKATEFKVLTQKGGFKNILYNFKTKKNKLKKKKDKKQKGGNLDNVNLWQPLLNPSYDNYTHYYDIKSGVDFLYNPENSDVFYLKQEDNILVRLGTANELYMDQSGIIPNIRFSLFNNNIVIDLRDKVNLIANKLDDIYVLPPNYKPKPSFFIQNATLSNPSSTQTMLIEPTFDIMKKLVKTYIQLNKNQEENQKYLRALIKMCSFSNLVILSNIEPNNPIPLMPLFYLLAYMANEHIIPGGDEFANDILSRNFIQPLQISQKNQFGDTFKALQILSYLNEIPFLKGKAIDLANLSNNQGIAGNTYIQFPNGFIYNIYGSMSGYDAQNYIITTEGTAGRLSLIDKSISSVKAKEYKNNIDKIVKLLLEILGSSYILALEDHFTNLNISLFKLRDIEKKIQKIEIEKKKETELKFKWFVEDFQAELKEAKSILPKTSEIENLINKYKKDVDNMTKISDEDMQIITCIILDSKRIPNIFDIKDPYIPTTNYKPYYNTETKTEENRPLNYSYPNEQDSTKIRDIYSDFLLGRIYSNSSIGQAFNIKFKQVLKLAVEKELHMMCGFYNYMKDQLQNITIFGDTEIITKCDTTMAKFKRQNTQSKKDKNKDKDTFRIRGIRIPTP